VTTSGSNPLIVLTAGIWQDVGGSGTIGSVSWNGAAFTKATSTRTTANETEIWYLAASTTGSKTISVTINGNTDAIKLGTASFSDVSASMPYDTVKSSNGFSTTPSVSVTPKFSSEVLVDSLARCTALDATTSLTALYKDYASSTLAASAYKFATSSDSGPTGGEVAQDGRGRTTSSGALRVCSIMCAPSCYRHLESEVPDDKTDNSPKHTARTKPCKVAAGMLRSDFHWSSSPA
jgi:hypothetical protein